MPSFDVVSSVNVQEVRNAVDQADKEIQTRYDFRGSKTSIELVEDKMIVLIADDDMRLTSVREILRLKFGKRGVSLKQIEFQDPKPAGGDRLRQEVQIKLALKDDELKQVTKAVKASGVKVTCAIQGEQVRVTGKKLDDLQSMIAHLKRELKDIELQFVNFRD